jgi:hypothetical protein
VAVGLFAGCLSTFGFGWLAGILEQKLNLGDTCGVHVSGIWGGGYIWTHSLATRTHSLATRVTLSTMI